MKLFILSLLVASSLYAYELQLTPAYISCTSDYSYGANLQLIDKGLAYEMRFEKAVKIGTDWSYVDICKEIRQINKRINAKLMATEVSQYREIKSSCHEVTVRTTALIFSINFNNGDYRSFEFKNIRDTQDLGEVNESYCYVESDRAK